MDPFAYRFGWWTCCHTTCPLFQMPADGGPAAKIRCCVTYGHSSTGRPAVDGTPFQISLKTYRRACGQDRVDSQSTI
jgi:hypothetical protein